MTTKENLLKSLNALYKGKEITITAYYVLLSGISQLEMVVPEESKEAK